MPTFLFDKIVFGPVKSRRLGVSLGINLLPVTGKICNFDCIYCECGMNSESAGKPRKLPTRQEVYAALEATLSEMLIEKKGPDVITFAGNGEPTLHPEFAGIIEDTLQLRDKYFKSATVSVLSNSTMLHKPEVFEALRKVDQNIMKLDSGLVSTVQKLNQPVGNYSIEAVVENLKRFKGDLIVQTMFVRGEIDGVKIDNTSAKDVASWIEVLKQIQPKQVMIYTIDRDTPHQGLVKVPLKELKDVGRTVEKLGIKVQVSG